MPRSHPLRATVHGEEAGIRPRIQRRLSRRADGRRDFAQGAELQHRQSIASRCAATKSLALLQETEWVDLLEQRRKNPQATRDLPWDEHVSSSRS
jgi:hypothetical protein